MSRAKFPGKIYIVLFLVGIGVVFQTGYAHGYIALSLRQLQNSLIQGKDVTLILSQFTDVVGTLLADGEDLILIGNYKKNSEPIGLETLTIAMRAAFLGYQPPGVISIGGLSPEASISTLVYAGSIENSVVGDFFAKCLKLLHALGNNEVKIELEGYWPYDNLPKVKLWIFPAKSGYFVSPDEKMMILANREVMIQPKETEVDALEPQLGEWIDQIIKRYDHLSGLFPELDQLKKFINLYKIFYWAKNHVGDSEKWKFLLKDYQLPLRYTPSSLKFNSKHSIAGGISCGIKAITSHPEQELNTVKQIILTAREPEFDALYWKFQSPSVYLKSEDWELRQLIEDSKISGLFGRSIFISLKTKSKNPTLSVWHNDIFYRRPSKTVHQLNRLIRQTLKGSGDYQTSWKKFYQNELALFANKSNSDQQHYDQSSKPLLILGSDDIADAWIILNKVDIIRDNFLLFLVPLQDKDDWKSAYTRFMDKARAFSAISGRDFAIALEIPDSQLNQYRSVIRELESILPGGNVLINPSIKDFERFVSDNKAPIKLLNLSLSNKEIQLKDGRLSYKDILKFKKMHHIKAIISISQGTGWGHHVYKVMQTKGAGVVSILPFGTISRKELNEFGLFLKNTESRPRSNILLSSGFTKLFGESLGWEKSHSRKFYSA